MEDDGDDDRGTSPAVWAAGAVALLILAAAGFLVFRLLSGPGTTPVADVTVPNFVGKTLAEAQALAAQNGITVTDRCVCRSERPAAGHRPGPGAGGRRHGGSGRRRGADAGRRTGDGRRSRPPRQDRDRGVQSARRRPDSRSATKTEAFDPVVPAGQIIHQSPAAGVARQQADADRLRPVEGPGAEPQPQPQPVADTLADSDPGPHPDPDPSADADSAAGQRDRRRLPCSPSARPRPTSLAMASRSEP